MVTGMPGHNRKPKPSPRRKTATCDNCRGKPVQRWHYGGTRLCKPCSDKLDAEEITWEQIQRNRYTDIAAQQE